MAAICLIEGVIALIVGALMIGKTDVQWVRALGAVVIFFGAFCGIMAGLGILDGQRWGLTLSGFAWFSWARRPEVEAYFAARSGVPRAAGKPAGAGFCRYCGARVSPEAEFCTKCGRKLR